MLVNICVDIKRFPICAYTAPNAEVDGEGSDVIGTFPRPKEEGERERRDVQGRIFL